MGGMEPFGFAVFGKNGGEDQRARTHARSLPFNSF